MIKTVPRLFLTRGLPGSGKSTWTKEMSELYPNLVIISADDIRRLLHATYDFSEPHKESFVWEMHNVMVDKALRSGKDVIIHNTNISIRNVAPIHKAFKRLCEFYIVDFTNVPIDVCLANDLKRVDTPAYVGEPIINRFFKTFGKELGKKHWNRFEFVTPLEANKILDQPQNTKVIPVYIPDENLDDVLLLDIDGTLANIGDRNPFDHTKYHLDNLNHAISKLTKAFTKTVVITGRDNKHREVTAKWLADNNVFYELLIMRPEGDTRPDYIVKQELFYSEIAPYYNAELVVEDRKQVVEMWREIGLLCAQVDEGDF